MREIKPHQGGAWCHTRHDRTGIVSNRDLSLPVSDGPFCSVSVCNRAECVAKGIKHVAGETNQTARFYSDAELAAGRSAS